MVQPVIIPRHRRRTKKGVTNVNRYSRRGRVKGKGKVTGEISHLKVIRDKNGYILGYRGN